MSADNSDERALLANTPNQTESLLHNREQAAGGICLHVNANKTEYMCFKRGVISISEISSQVHVLRQ